MNNLWLILVGPSGVGKSSVQEELLDDDKQFSKSVSYTNRPRRDKEKNGKDYHFITDEIFDLKFQRGDFIAHSRIYDYHYGTDKDDLYEIFSSGKDAISIMDWKGLDRVKGGIYQDNIHSIYLFPDRIKDLFERLKERSWSQEEHMWRRTIEWGTEIEHWKDCDGWIVNDYVEDTAEAIQNVVYYQREHIRYKNEMRLHAEKLEQQADNREF